MKRLTVIVVMFLLLVLTGCWSSRELTDLSIIMGMALDKVDDEYEITVEAMIPSSVTAQFASQTSPAMLFSSKSPSICEGFRKLSYTMPRAPDISHVSEILIHEDVAKEGLSTILDCFLRDDEFRLSTRLFVVTGSKAKDVLGVSTTMETVAANKIDKITKRSSEIYSAVRDMDVTNFINAMIAEGQEAIIPGFKVEGAVGEDLDESKTMKNTQTTDPKVRIKVIPFAVFKRDQLVGWLDENTAKGVNLMMNEVKNTMISAMCDEGKYMVIELLKGKTKMTAKIIDHVPRLEMTVKVRARLCQVDCNFKLMEEKTHKKMERDFEKAIKTQLEDTIYNLQKTIKSDIVGFGELIRRKDPLYWKNIKKDWDQYFQSLDVNVKVEVKFTDFGSSGEPLNSETKEE